MQNSTYLTNFSFTEKQTHLVHRSFPTHFGTPGLLKGNEL